MYYPFFTEKDPVGVLEEIKAERPPVEPESGDAVDLLTAQIWTLERDYPILPGEFPNLIARLSVALPEELKVYASVALLGRWRYEKYSRVGDGGYNFNTSVEGGECGVEELESLLWNYTEPISRKNEETPLLILAFKDFEKGVQRALEEFPFVEG